MNNLNLIFFLYYYLNQEDDRTGKVISCFYARLIVNASKFEFLFVFRHWLFCEIFNKFEQKKNVRVVKSIIGDKINIIN